MANLTTANFNDLELLERIEATLYKDNYIFIHGNVPSLKNGKVKGPRGIYLSKTVKEYVKDTSPIWAAYKNLYLNAREDIPLDQQICCRYTFVRQRYKTKEGFKDFDFCNAIQTLEDCMSANVYLSMETDKEASKKAGEKVRLRVVNTAHLHTSLKPRRKFNKYDVEGFRERHQWLLDDSYQYIVPVINPTVFESLSHAGVFLEFGRREDFMLPVQQSPVKNV